MIQVKKQIKQEEKEKRFIEAIDLLPTFLDAVESKASKHRLEGSSLIPILRDEKLANGERVYLAR